MVPKVNETEGVNLSLRHRVRRFWMENRAVNDLSGGRSANQSATEEISSRSQTGQPKAP
jgi:hypothetical protein